MCLFSPKAIEAAANKDYTQPKSTDKNQSVTSSVNTNKSIEKKDQMVVETPKTPATPMLRCHL